MNARLIYSKKHYFRFIPINANKAESDSAVMIIIIAARRAAGIGNPGEGVEVGGKSVLVEVGVDVGQEVIVGIPVGVSGG